jgi:hypothetical protein
LTQTDTLSNSIIGSPDKMISYGDPVRTNLLSNDADPQGDNITFNGVKDPNNPGFINN